MTGRKGAVASDATTMRISFCTNCGRDVALESNGCCGRCGAAMGVPALRPAVEALPTDPAEHRDLTDPFTYCNQPEMCVLPCASCGVRATHAKRRAKGQRSVGRPALIDNPDLVERIRAMRAQGLSYGAICRQLNAEGVPTVRGAGTWQKSALQSVLNPGFREKANDRNRRRHRERMERDVSYRKQRRKQSREQDRERERLVKIGRSAEGQRALLRLANDAGAVGKVYTTVIRHLQALDRLPYTGKERGRLEREAIAGLHKAEDALGLWLRLEEGQ